MPFGGEDCLATIYAYNAMNRLADLEDQIAAHPEWNLPKNLFDQDTDFLRIRNPAGECRGSNFRRLTAPTLARCLNGRLLKGCQAAD